jgi:hypothetical protein
MGLVAKGGSGANFDPVAEGVHNAVCYMVLDLGTHLDEKYGKRSHSCLIGWEIPGERIIIEKDGVKRDLPRAISKKYTISLNEKANLRKDLQTWRGRVFTDAELDGFDIKNLLGKSCMIQIIHTKKGEKTYANISAIMPLMKGAAPITPENPLKFYSIEDDRDVIPADTPQWIIDIIKISDEWQEFAPLQGASSGGTGVPEDDNDDVPF